MYAAKPSWSFAALTSRLLSLNHCNFKQMRVESKAQSALHSISTAQHDEEEEEHTAAKLRGAWVDGESIYGHLACDQK